MTMGLLRHVRATGAQALATGAQLVTGARAPATGAQLATEPQASATGAHALATGGPALTDEPPRAATCPRSGRRRVYR
ncbi:hypothetical protein [Actinoallomurus sp. CA-150999]|uniref:hypothetical protein n=1 Tax=Actinoallomurus sp. CA-150999 TaxID=3239887 RepID=UPI003D8EBB05